MTTNGNAVTAKDNWTKGMKVIYNDVEWEIGWKGLIKNTPLGRSPYRCLLINKDSGSGRYWVDGKAIDSIIAAMHGEEPEDEANDNLDIDTEEIALILRALYAMKKELLAYTKKSGISRFKLQEAAADIKAVNALREKLATIE